jgi:hypothetical protein
MEGVQNDHQFPERRHKYGPKGTRSLSNPDFARSGSNGFHWFPVTRVIAVLDFPELETRFGTGIIGKVS